MCFLMSTAACANTSSRSSEALTSSPISARGANTSGFSVVKLVSVLGSVASMKLVIIAGARVELVPKGLEFCQSFFKALKSMLESQPVERSTWLFGLPGGARTKMQNANVGQVAVALGVVQAVADDELIGNREAGVVGAHIGNAALRLVQEHDHANQLGLFLFKEPEQVVQREAGVENILDHDHGFPFDTHVEVLDQFHFSRGVGPLPVTRNRQEIEGNFPSQLSGQIREKKNRSFQDSD